MNQSTLRPGELVRYQATAAEWYFGIVRQLDGDDVEVKFFSGDTEAIPQEEVERFHDYLAGRQRVLSLTRAQLCIAFFNNPLYRRPQAIPLVDKPET